MAITATQVKELRERTAAGMMECKRALTETEGDMDSAIELLRKNGAASAEKKSGRIAAEGVIALAIDPDQSHGVLVEINCETDFVAKDQSFLAFSEELAKTVLAEHPTDMPAVSLMLLAGGKSVEETRQTLIAKIGENISVRRFEVIQGNPGEISGYSHGTRIGVLVKILNSDTPSLGRDIAMHVAASQPLCIDETGMPSDVLEKERNIYRAQAIDSGKSEEIVQKMVEGKVRKFLKDNTLTGQPFVKDPDTTVHDLLKAHGAVVVTAPRFEVGEGLTKRADDFVSEVMAQAQAG
ncbi:MAG: translation elongation factor Ts [Arenicellales bacterium]|jgi:elongation factor Ts|nr:translation elongation factor Ts [Arenicellales bacterium]